MHGHPWTRAETELLRQERTPRATEILDLVAAQPQRRFSIPDLVRILDLDSEHVFSGLLGELTKAEGPAGINQDEPHSWFLLWSNKPAFTYWLDQERAGWWEGQPERKTWALMGNPRKGYDVVCGIRNRKTDWWTTKGSNLQVGDRVAIWKTLGGRNFPDERGVIAFGQVVSGPEVRGDPESICYADEAPEPPVEERVEVRYHLFDGDPLWINGPAHEVVSSLTVSRAQGGTAFHVSPEHWNGLLEAAGGWPLPADREDVGWAPGEVRAVVASYLAMVRSELSAEPYSKTEFRRE